MAKKTRSNTSKPTEVDTTLKERVQAAVLKVWQQIAADAGELLEGGDPLEIMVELCLDADRPVNLGGLSMDDYRSICDMGVHGQEEVDGWAREVLRPYV